MPDDLGQSAGSGETDARERETAALPAGSPPGGGMAPGAPGWARWAGGVPTKVGSYVVKRVIGEGGMGVVVEAEHERLGSRAAVKLMRWEGAWSGAGGGAGGAGGTAAARFADEARVLAMLDHPAICRVLDAGTFTAAGPGGEPRPRSYFAMELLDGARDVLTYCTQRGLSVAERVRLMLPIVDAVEYGHEKGVLHRDVKPDNILVVEPGGTGSSAGSAGSAGLAGEGGRGAAKLIDFGIARAVGSEAVRGRLTEPGMFLGTPRYASPEQLSGRPHLVDRRSDVYALGVVLHELVFGSHPYGLEGMDAHDAAERMRHAGALRPTRAEYRELETVLHTAVQLDPALRYQTAAGLAADLRRWLAEEPVLARRPTAVTLAARRARTVASRNRPLTRAVVGVAAATVMMLPPAPARWGLEAAQRGWAAVMAPVWAGRASTEGVVVLRLGDESRVEELGPVLGIGEVTHEPGPGWRRMHARVIRELAGAGARVIAFDMMFDPGKGTPEGDREFAEAVEAARGVPVVVTVGKWSAEARGVIPEAWEGRVVWGPATMDRMPGFWLTDLALSRREVGAFPSMPAAVLAVARAAGLPGATPVVSVHGDVEVVRVGAVAGAGRPGGGLVEPAGRMEEVPVQLGEVGEDDAELGLRRGDELAMLVSQPWTRAMAAAATVDYSAAARGDPSALSAVKGRVVLVARCMASNSEDRSEHPTQGGEEWRAYAHASAISAMLQRRFVRFPGVLTEWAVTGAAAGLGCFGAAWPRRARGRLAWGAGLTALIGVGSVAAWYAAGLVVLVAQPVAALVAAGAFVWWLAPRAAR